MNNQYYQMPGVSSAQYAPYGAADPLHRELIASYDEAVHMGVESLQKLSLAELRVLNENPDRLSSFVKDSFLTQPMMKTMMKCREKTKEQANENLKFSPQLEESRQEVSEKYEELKELQNSYKDVNTIYLQLCQKYNPQNIAQGLMDSVGKIDEESEKVAENFLCGKKDLDSFLDEYIRRRTMSHSQKTKYDKLSNQLEKLHQANHF